MRSLLRPLVLLLALSAGPAARAQGAAAVAPPGGPSPTGVTLASAVATSGLVGAGALLVAVDSEGGPLLLTGAGLLAIGLALGPSTGNLVAGGYRDAAIGAGLRIAGAAALGGAASMCGVGGCRNGGALIALGSAGAVLIVGGVAYDLLTAPGNARRGRERRAARLETGVGYYAGENAPLVAVRVRF